jgi:succinoglycan biosynthesis transport protein ExoP
MLQIDKRRIAEQVVQEPEEASVADLYIAAIGFVRRQFSTIVFVLLLTLGLAAVYLFTAAPKYSGHAVLVIDTHKSQVFLPDSPLGEIPIDSATVDTQLEILKSENIALSVIKELHLTDDPEFVAPSSFIRKAIETILEPLLFIVPAGSDAPESDFERTRVAFYTFEGRLTVKRVGMTYAIDIEFQSLNPERAAQVANAVADAYVVDALEAKYQTTRRAAVWLQDRLKELREQSSNAERAVVDYKTKNNIVDTGGRLMNEQQLAELNSGLLQARAMSAEAKARLDRVQQILGNDNLDPASSAAATVTDSLHNEVIIKLRQQYLDYAAKVADWTPKYGANHLAVVNLRNQMQELRHNIVDELRRIAETYKSDFEIAKAREESMQKSLDQIVAQSQTTNEAQITLHDLDSSAQTYRALYDNFLQRYMESVQQQSFPVNESRLVTQATRPLEKSSPRTILIIPLALVAGMMLGVGVGAFRDISDRVFRTTSQVEEALQTDCIAVVPLIKGVAKSADRSTAGLAVDVQPGRVGPRSICRESGLLWTVVDAPLSRFAESIRGIKVAADLNKVGKPNKVIGITSTLPNEGKSTIAMALGELIAHSGGRVLLVDCDLRNPSLSRQLAPQAAVGLLDLISGKAFLHDVVWTDPATKLSFLPAVLPARLAHSSDILASEATRKLFEKLREAFDYVIVDLSPLAPVVDVRAMTHLVDTFVFVIEWGRTKTDVVEHALEGARGVYQNLLGIVLNKADMDSLGRYESYRSNYYHNRYYVRYGYTD